MVWLQDEQLKMFVTADLSHRGTQPLLWSYLSWNFSWLRQPSILTALSRESS